MGEIRVWAHGRDKSGGPMGEIRVWAHGRDKSVGPWER